jgi:uncharacterized protein YukE
MAFKLKSLFYDDIPEVDTPVENTDAAAQSVESISTPVTVPQPSPIIGDSLTGLVDDKFVQFFTKILDEANLDGIDYYEFKKAYEATTAIAASMTEDLRYKMVYTQMSVQGLTKKTLTDAIATYLKILEEKHAESLQSFEEKKDKEIGSRTKELEAIAKSTQDKSEQIQKLTNEIIENQNRETTLKGEVATETSKIDQKFKNFDASYNSVVNQIKGDLTKIESYILT